MEGKIINPSIHNWVNNNRDLLLKYKGKWVAFNENGLLGADETLAALRQMANTLAEKYSVYYVHPDRFGKITFRPIQFRSVFFHDWPPLYDVQLAFGNEKIDLPMLIDSGADACLINFETGKTLGLEEGHGETKQVAKGIGGGSIQYIWRDLKITIDGNTVVAPVAWILEGEKQENIIGRQIVFDAWDIEFKQAEETILFKFRGAPNYP